MLKLIKHDFISTGRIMGVAYAIIAGLVAFTFITKRTDSTGTLSVLGAGILGLVAIVLFIFTAVILMMDFHKTLYCDRGYLTFTLPVKSWKILSSKIIVSGIWLLLALVAVLGSGLLVVYSVDSSYGDEVSLLTDFVEQFSGKNVASYIAYLFTEAVVLFIEFCCVAIVVALASTLSNVSPFQKHPVIFTIIFSVINIYILSKIGELANKFIAFGVFFVEGRLKFAFNNDAYYQFLNRGPVIDLGELFVYIICGVGFFYLTHWLMSKKVNIK